MNGVKLATLLILLLICLGLLFGYPLFAPKGDLRDAAEMLGFFGAIVTFISIIAFIFRREPDAKATENEDDDEDEED